MKVYVNNIHVSHNQVVPGSGPGGPTTKKSSTKVGGFFICKCFIFAC